LTGDRRSECLATQVVVVIPTPKPPSVVFCWSRFGAFRRTTLPGLAVRSTEVGTPVWKSDWLVSTKQPEVGAVVSEKSFVVVVLSVTTIFVTLPELNPGLLAVSLGYVPDGMPANE